MFSNELVNLSLIQARNGLLKKDFSSFELTSSYIKNIKEKSHLNSYILSTPDIALLQSNISDQRIKMGNDVKNLEGLPLSVKDVFCTKNICTTAGSCILQNFIPPYESTVTNKIFNEGAVLLGKNNMDEFSMGSSTVTSFFGSTKNPWIRKDGVIVTPGGSSGGSAAAVAAGLSLASFGTDTGGSIRQPASFSGVVGMKPTYGRCSRWGMIAFASSLDQAGIITRTVRDSAALLQAIAGFDPKDSTSSKRDVPNFESFSLDGLKGLKVGIPREYNINCLDKEINTLWQKGINWLNDAGADIIEVSLPHFSYSLPAYYIISSAECSSNLARYDGVRYGLRVPGKILDEMYENTRYIGFGDEVKRRIIVGTYVLSSGYYEDYYLKAQKVRHLISQDFINVFKSVNLILTPTTPGVAFPLKNNSGDNPHLSPTDMYKNDIFTAPASLAGIPAISVPVGLSSSGLPIGLQLMGAAFNESIVFRAASILENYAKFKSFLESIDF